MGTIVCPQQVLPFHKRDFNIFPIRQANVDILKPSIELDWWAGIMTVPEGREVKVGKKVLKGQELVEYLSTLDVAFTLTTPEGKTLKGAPLLKFLRENDPINTDMEGYTFNPLFNVMQLFGHHRTYTADKVGLQWYEVLVKDVDEPTQDRMFVEENHSDHGGNMEAMFETVRLMRESCQEEFDAYDSFAEYQKGGGTLWDSQSAWDQVPSQGIGAGTVHRRLGEDTWNLNEVRFAFNAMRAVELGVYDREILADFPNIGMVGAFSSLAMEIMAQGDWPIPFREDLISKAANLVVSEDSKVSIASMRQALKNLKAMKDDRPDRWDPISYLDDGAKRRPPVVDFVIEAIGGMDVSEDDKTKPAHDWKAKLDELKEAEGYKNISDLAKLMSKVRSKLKKHWKTVEEESGQPGGDDQTDVQDQVDAATGEVPEDTEEALEEAKGTVAAFVQSTEGYTPNLTALASCGATVMENEELQTQFVESFDTLIAEIASAAVHTIGEKEFNKKMKAAFKAA